MTLESIFLLKKCLFFGFLIFNIKYFINTLLLKKNPQFQYKNISVKLKNLILEQRIAGIVFILMLCIIINLYYLINNFHMKRAFSK